MRSRAPDLISIGTSREVRVGDDKSRQAQPTLMNLIPDKTYLFE